MQSVHDIKMQNTYRILNAIRFNGGQTKKEIASDTGLSVATVSNICRELKEKRLILEVPMDKSDLGVGRLPSKMLLNYSEFFGVCIDMHSRERTVLALTNLRNEIIIKKEVRLRKWDQLMDFIEDCHKVCTQACEEAGVNREQLLGLCVAIPAIYDIKTGLAVGVCAGFYESLLEGQSVKALFEEVFRLPVVVDNESNIASMFITSHNALSMQSVKNLMYISCSEGLGIGIIADGKQLVGCDGHAGEICHIPIGSEKLLCKLCGNTGCAESDLSLFGFITKYLDSDEWNKEELYVYWDKFLAAVERGEAKALAVVDENAKVFGKLLSILVNLFDPEIIYVGGNGAVLFERMRPLVEAEVASRLIARDHNPTILLQDNDKNTIIYGCAEIVYSGINFAAL